MVEGIGLCDGFEHTVIETDIVNDLAQHSKQVTETDPAEAFRAISKQHNSNAVNESPLTTSSPSPILTSPTSSSPFLPASQARGHELSQSAMKRRGAKAYDTALDVALQMTTQLPPTPSFSKSISAVVENTINLVPTQLKIELGFAILQSAHQLFEKLKEKHNF